MEKNKMLKICSILLIVFGAIIALVSIIFFAAGDLVAGIVGEGSDVGSDVIKLVVIILGVALLIEGIAYIVAGVIGVKQKSAKLCFIVGIVLVVVCGISAIMSIVEGQIVSAITGMIIPVLYLVGAIQLKKSVAAPVEQVQSDDAQN